MSIYCCPHENVSITTDYIHINTYPHYLVSCAQVCGHKVTLTLNETRLRVKHSRNCLISL
ncbi:hypothetical protein PSP6_480002 [Paraburkholderia tropica]|nr:hypothetical protein PSP6_480002 [Paraburkholderia tropica]